LARKAARFPIEPAQVPGVDLYSFRIGERRFAVLSLPGADGPAAAPDALSPAECAVAGLLLEGLSNAEIAARRRSAVRTVCNQIASVYRKLGVRSRAELATRQRALAGPSRRKA
jgi:DNA-binding NarL/FixJ family response regulator